MKSYIAWMSHENTAGQGQSVHMGSLKECKNTALKIHNSKRWKTFSKGLNTKVVITRGSKQLFATSYILTI